MKNQTSLGEILAQIPQPVRNPEGVRIWLCPRDLEQRAAEFDPCIQELCEGIGQLPEGEHRTRIARAVEQVKELARRLARVESLASECERTSDSSAGYVLVVLEGDDNRAVLEQLAVARDRRQDAADLRSIYAKPMHAGFEALTAHIRAELANAPKVEPGVNDDVFRVKTASERRAGKGVAIA